MTVQRFEDKSVPTLAKIREELHAISPELLVDIELLLDPDKITDIPDLKNVTLFFFRNLLLGRIPFNMSGEIRAWCRDLLPILISARNPLNQGNNGLVIQNNTLLQIIQRGEAPPVGDIRNYIGMKDTNIDVKKIMDMPQEQNITNIPAVEPRQFLIDIDNLGELE